MHVSIFKDDQRTAFVNPVVSVYVDKKSSTSTLVLQANLCVHGEHDPACSPIITYNHTTTFGQSEYCERSLLCYGLIEGHTTVGIQNLTISFNEGLKPYMIKNPNVSDHVDYENTPTCSIIRVEELEL